MHHTKKISSITRLSFMHHRCMSGKRLRFAFEFGHPNDSLVLPLMSAKQSRELLEFMIFQSNTNASWWECLAKKYKLGTHCAATEFEAFVWKKTTCIQKKDQWVKARSQVCFLSYILIFQIHFLFVSINKRFDWTHWLGPTFPSCLKSSSHYSLWFKCS